MKRTSRSEEPVQIESVEKVAPTVHKVKKPEMSKQKRKITGREKWLKGKLHKRCVLEEKGNEFLHCSTQLVKNMLHNQVEGVKSNDGDNAFGNLACINLKQLPRQRLSE